MLNAWTFNYEGLLTAYAVRRRGVWSGTFFISHWEIQWQMYWYSAGYLNNYIVLVYYFHSTDKIVHRRFLSEAKSAALSLVNLWPIWGRLYCVRALPHRHFNSTCIDVEFTYYKIHLFKIHNQWSFLQPSPITNLRTFCHPKRETLHLSAVIPHSLFPPVPGSHNVLSVSVDSVVWTFHVNEIHFTHFSGTCDGIPSASIVVFMQASSCCSVYHHFTSFHGWVILHCMDMTYCTYPFISWWTLGVFLLFSFICLCKLFNESFCVGIVLLMTLIWKTILYIYMSLYRYIQI